MVTATTTAVREPTPFYYFNSSDERTEVNNVTPNDASVDYYYEIPWKYLILAYYIDEVIQYTKIGISIFGMVTNTITIVVFYRQGLFKDSCATIFSCLALVDLCYCIVAFSFLFLMEVTRITKTILLEYDLSEITRHWLIIIENHTGYLCFFVQRPVRMLGQMASWITTYLAMERFVSVTFPFHVKRIFTPGRSGIAVVCIFSACVLIYLNEMANQRLLLETANNITMLSMEYKALPRFFRDIGNVNQNYIRIVIFALLLSFNIFIISKVQLSKQFKKTTTSNSTHGYSSKQTADEILKLKSVNKKKDLDKETKLTRTMLVISLVYVICFLPKMIISYIGSIRHVNRLWELSEIINSSSNFIIYYKMSSKFKNEVKQLNLCCRKSGPQTETETKNKSRNSS